MKFVWGFLLFWLWNMSGDNHMILSAYPYKTEMNIYEN